MFEHQVTKIIRFDDRYDFTFRLVPLFKFYQIDEPYQLLCILFKEDMRCMWRE